MTDTAVKLAREKVELEQRLFSINLMNTYGRSISELIELETNRIETEKALVSVREKINTFIYSPSEKVGDT